MAQRRETADASEPSPPFLPAGQTPPGTGQGLQCCCINQKKLGAAWGTRAKFVAEHPMMWFRVFISTNARIHCPTELFLLNEIFLKKQTSAKSKQPSITGKDKVNFSLPSPQPINSSVVWCHPHSCAIFNLNFCLLGFEAVRTRFLNLCCSYKLHETFKTAFLVSSQNRLQNGDLPAFWPGMEARWQPLGRGGAKRVNSAREHRAREKPAPPAILWLTALLEGCKEQSPR